MSNVRSKVSRGSLEREDLIQPQAEIVEMTLNTANSVASGLLIQRLTELYEDPVEASVRETISNALDAVTEAHSGDYGEVRISSPNGLNPVLNVRDNGVGMSYNDLKEIYSKYGASTKMDNMDQIGAYGLGAKAPLAYGTEFTVSSVKDGELTTIIVAREELTNYIKIIDSGETDSPSGTSVSIPVNNDDIGRFENEVNKYNQNPIDKDNVKIFIDDEEVVNDNYIQVTDELVVFREGDKEVTARLWVDKSTNLITNILSHMSEDDVRRSLEYLIGGWSYRNPTTRRGWFNSTKGIIVELKAGIVSFNSSRDAILENDRYTALEDLIIEYIRSEKFTEDLTNAVNEIDINSFKSIVVKLLQSNSRNIEVKDGRINVSQSSSFTLVKSYSISDFIHESGFKIDNIFNGVPKTEKATAIIMEQKRTYETNAKNSIMSTRDSFNNASNMIETQVTGMLESINKIMNEQVDAHSLESIMLNLALELYSDDDENKRVTFITDIDLENDDDEKTFSRVRSGRKSIVRMRNNETLTSYKSYLIYTKHNKADIEKMIEEAKFNDLDVVVKTAKETYEELREYRRLNRTTTKSIVNKGLQTFVKRLDDEKGTVRVDVEKPDSEFNENKDNVIVITKDRYIDSVYLRMVRAWYCNTNNKDIDDVDVYYSRGVHRKVDLEILSELGELYEDPNTSPAGHSKLYKDLMKDRTAEFHLMNKSDENKEAKAISRLIASFVRESPARSMATLQAKFIRAGTVSKLSGVDFTPLKTDILDRLGELGNDEFGTSYNSWDWDLRSSTEKELLQEIDEDKYDLILDISAIIGYNSRKVLNDDGFLSTNRGLEGVTSIPNDDEIAESYSDDNANSRYHKVIRSRVESYLEFMNDVAEELSNISIQ